jgi:hypothetical protein
LKGDPMVTVIEELEDPEGNKTWLRLNEVLPPQRQKKEWLYIPIRGTNPEKYVPYTDGSYKNWKQKLGTQPETKPEKPAAVTSAQQTSPAKVETEAERKERNRQEREEKKRVEREEDLKSRGDAGREQLAKGTYPAPKESAQERFAQTKGKRELLKQKLAKGLEWQVKAANWPAPLNSVATRVPVTFGKLTALLDKPGALEMTGDLEGKVDDVVLPLSGKQPPEALPENEMRKVSESLAEVDYAVIVMTERVLSDPFVLGAQSRTWAPGQTSPTEDEDPHGDLPPLHTLNFEVDAYYRTDDGVLHADEVKDTPRAFAHKIGEELQLARQLRWLALPLVDRKQNKIKKRIGYFIRGTLPKFDEVLDDGVIRNLELLDAEQRGEKFIRFASESFAVADLRLMTEQAKKWLEDSKPALKLVPEFNKESGKLDNSAVFKKYFDDLVTTRKTLAAGPLKLPASTEKPAEGDTGKTSLVGKENS